MAQECNNTMPDVVLESDCRPIAETIGIFLAMTNPTLAEPIDDVEVANDATAADTYTDLLESGSARYYKIVATDKTSPSKREGSIGVKTIPISLEEGSYIFHIETSDEYLKAIKQMKRFTGKYAATVGADNWIQLAKDDNTSSVLRFLKIESVFGLGADPMNNGSDVPVYLVEVKFSGNETYNKISRELEVEADTFEQKYTIDSTDFTLAGSVTSITLTDNSGNGILVDGSGTTGSDVLLSVDGSDVELAYTVTGGVLTVTGGSQVATDAIVMSISNESGIWDDNYYGYDGNAVVA